jgi:hypothetical protein
MLQNHINNILRNHYLRIHTSISIKGTTRVSTIN